MLGGVAWERLPIDPKPGPRPVSEITRRPIRSATTRCSRGPRPRPPRASGSRESHVAGHLGTPDGADRRHRRARRAPPRGSAAAAGLLGCDLVVYVDVGGDAIAAGHEPGLGEPAVRRGHARRRRCDWAAAWTGPWRVLGAGCDGELTVDEVLDRVAELAAAGAWIGTSGVTPAIADELERAAEPDRHRGEPAGGPLRARRARRRPRSAAAGAPSPSARSGRSAFYFDLDRAVAVAAAGARRRAAPTSSRRLATRSRALGVSTELDYERERASR